MSTRRVPVAEPGRACEAHNAVAKVGRRSQRDRSSGINRRAGRWKAPYYLNSIEVVSSAPSECSAWWRHGPERCVGIWRVVVWVMIVEVLPLLTPLCPAGHLPLRWGDRLGLATRSNLNVLRRACRGSISLLEGEMSGRTEGGAPHGTPSRTSQLAKPHVNLAPAKHFFAKHKKKLRILSKLHFPGYMRDCGLLHAPSQSAPPSRRRPVSANGFQRKIPGVHNRRYKTWLV